MFFTSRSRDCSRSGLPRRDRRHIRPWTVQLHLYLYVHARLVCVYTMLGGWVNHTESNKLYRKVKHRVRPNLSSRQRPKRALIRRRSRRRQRRGEPHTEHGLGVLFASLLLWMPFSPQVLRLWLPPFTSARSLTHPSADCSPPPIPIYIYTCVCVYIYHECGSVFFYFRSCDCDCSYLPMDTYIYTRPACVYTHYARYPIIFIPQALRL